MSSIEIDKNTELTETSNIPPIPLDLKLHRGFAIAELVVYPDKGEIIKNQQHYHVSTKAMELLLVLCSHAGQIISRQSLLDRVWGDAGAAGSNLTHAITELRHLMDDSKECPTYIQTIPRKGYRLLVPVVALIDNPLSVDIWSLAEHIDDDEKRKNIPGKRRRSLNLERWRRSYLFKIAGAYIFMSWVLMQVAAVTLPIFNAAKWLDKLILLLLIVGFPLVLFYSWWQELRLRLQFIVNQSDLQNKQKITRRAYKDLIYIGIFASLCAITSVYLTKQIMRSADTVAQVAVDHLLVAEVFDNAVALLPFKQIGEHQSDYFISTLQSELLTFLSQSKKLKIASERVISALPDNPSLATIRARTGAKYVLEGQVNRINQRISITTTLTDTGTGYQVWASKIDSELTNNLSLHEKLSRQIFSALTFIMPHDENDELQFKPTDDFQAYDLFMQGKTLLKDAYNEEQLKKAEQFFLTALAQDAKFELAEAGLCQTYLEQYKLLKMKQIYELARQSCQKAIDSNKLKVGSEIALGNLYSTSGEYAQASLHYQQAIMLQPKNSLGLVGLAGVFVSLEQYPQAEELFIQSIQAEPGYWRNYQSYGGFLFNLGRYSEASLQYKKQSILQPDSEQAFSNLGGAYYLNLEFEKATASWRKALAIKPSEQTFSNLGTSLFYSLDFEQAAAMYEQALQINSSDFLFKANLADAMKYIPSKKARAKQLFAETLQQAQDVERVNPQDLEIKANIARYYTELAQCSNAKAYSEDVLRSNSHNPYIYYNLALAANNCGDRTEVIKMLKQTLLFGYPEKLLAQDHQFEAYKKQILQLQQLKEKFN
jgi:DNA-binding winged helix-turn-helix (wHTH) protein/tetratricopeptide (TPR) repeat protein